MKNRQMSTQKNELYHILSPEWLKTNPLPEDGEFENNDGKWLVSSRRGHVTPGWNEYPYRTRRTDLPPEAYITPPTDTTGAFPSKEWFEARVDAEADHEVTAGSPDTTGSGREGVNYDGPAPETEAFMTLIDDSAVDLGQIQGKLAQFECERDAALAQVEALRRDGERLDWLSRFFSFENVDYSDVEQASYWGWNISDDALLQALGGTKGMPDPIPTLRAAIDSAQRQEGA